MGTRVENSQPPVEPLDLNRGELQVSFDPEVLLVCGQESCDINNKLLYSNYGVTVDCSRYFKEKGDEAIVGYLSERAKFWRDYQPTGSELAEPTELKEYLNPSAVAANVPSSGEQRDVIDGPVENSSSDWPAVSEAVYAVTAEEGDPRAIIADKFDRILLAIKSGEYGEKIAQDLQDAFVLDSLARQALLARETGDIAYIGGEEISLKNILWDFAKRKSENKDTNEFQFVESFETRVNIARLSTGIDQNIATVDMMIRGFKDQAPKTLFEVREKLALAKVAVDSWDLETASENLRDVSEISLRLEGDLAWLRDRIETEQEHIYGITAGVIIVAALTAGIGEFAGGGVGWLVGRLPVLERIPGMAPTLKFFAPLFLSIGAGLLTNSLLPKKMGGGGEIEPERLVFTVLAIAISLFIKTGNPKAVSTILTRMGTAYGFATVLDAAWFSFKEGDITKGVKHATEPMALYTRFLYVGSAVLTSALLTELRGMPLAEWQNKLYRDGRNSLAASYKRDVDALTARAQEQFANLEKFKSVGENDLAKFQNILVMLRQTARSMIELMNRAGRDGLYVKDGYQNTLTDVINRVDQVLASNEIPLSIRRQLSDGSTQPASSNQPAISNQLGAELALSEALGRALTGNRTALPPTGATSVATGWFAYGAGALALPEVSLPPTLLNPTSGLLPQQLPAGEVPTISLPPESLVPVEKYSLAGGLTIGGLRGGVFSIPKAMYAGKTAIVEQGVDAKIDRFFASAGEDTEIFPGVTLRIGSYAKDVGDIPRNVIYFDVKQPSGTLPGDLFWYAGVASAYKHFEARYVDAQKDMTGRSDTNVAHPDLRVRLPADFSQNVYETFNDSRISTNVAVAVAVRRWGMYIPNNDLEFQVMDVREYRSLYNNIVDPVVTRILDNVTFFGPFFDMMSNAAYRDQAMNEFLRDMHDYRNTPGIAATAYNDLWPGDIDAHGRIDLSVIAPPSTIKDVLVRVREVASTRKKVLIVDDFNLGKWADRPADLVTLDYLLRTVMNLFVNATIYGGDRCFIRSSVQYVHGEDVPVVVIDVGDEGPGMQRDDFIGAGNPEWGRRHSDSGSARGTGHGLVNIVKFADKMGGEVRFISTAVGEDGITHTYTKYGSRMDRVVETYPSAAHTGFHGIIRIPLDKIIPSFGRAPMRR